MPPRTNPAFFKPPEETLSIFDDLPEDNDDQIENEAEDGSEVSSSSSSQYQEFRNLFPNLFPPRRDSEYHNDYHARSGHEAVGQTRKTENYDEDDDDEPAVFLNKPRRPPRLPTLTGQGRDRRKYIRDRTRRSPYPLPVTTNVFQSSIRQQKRIEQLQRLADTEAEVCRHLEEFPNDTTLCGKLLHLQACKGRLEGGEGEILSPGEVRFLYDTNRLLERRRVSNEEKKFLRQAKEALHFRSRGIGGGQNWKGERHEREEAVVRSSSSYPSSSPVRKRSYSPSPHPTTGGKLVLHDPKRQKVDSEDGEDNNDDGEEEHITYGGKTIGQGEALKVEKYDVHAALKEQEDDGEKNDKNDDESEDSDESSDGETDLDQ